MKNLFTNIREYCKSNSKRITVGIIICACLVLLLIALAIYLHFNSKPEVVPSDIPATSIVSTEVDDSSDTPEPSNTTVTPEKTTAVKNVTQKITLSMTTDRNEYHVGDTIFVKLSFNYLLDGSTLTAKMFTLNGFNGEIVNLTKSSNVYTFEVQNTTAKNFNQACTIELLKGSINNDATLSNKFMFVAKDTKIGSGNSSSNSSDSSNSGTPGNPETPEVPETPDKPGTPDKPEVPEVPETPETPEVPETPDKPEVPEVPETPETPEVPETPDKPEVPEVPETPETPEVPDDSHQKPPSDSSNDDEHTGGVDPDNSNSSSGGSSSGGSSSGGSSSGGSSSDSGSTSGGSSSDSGSTSGGSSSDSGSTSGGSSSDSGSSSGGSSSGGDNVNTDGGASNPE